MSSCDAWNKGSVLVGTRLPLEVAMPLIIQYFTFNSIKSVIIFFKKSPLQKLVILT